MSSELVKCALRQVPNRYLLTRLAAKAAASSQLDS